MDYQISDFFAAHGNRVRDVEKARVYELIVKSDGISRKQIQGRLKCRPTNISEDTQQLLDEGLIYEDDIVKQEGKGRPEILLRACFDRLVSVAIWVDATKLRGYLVDMGGNIISSIDKIVSPDADNAIFFNAIEELAKDMIISIGKKQKLVGIGLALPGAVMVNTYRWSFNSHFPNVRNLDFFRLSEIFGIPIRIHRILDAQLNAMYLLKHILSGRTSLLVHWGDGIGASLGLNGQSLGSVAGCVCEIGHIKVDRTASGRICKCKERGCLETVSAGWYLFPKLEAEFGPFSDNEAENGEILRACRLEGNELIEEAISVLADVIDGVYRTCFPEKIIIYGPFIMNDWIRARLFNSLEARFPEFARQDVSIEMLHGNLEVFTAFGCTSSFFISELQNMLVYRL